MQEPAAFVGRMPVGASSSRVFSATNLHWPDAVFQMGYAQEIEHEADMLQRVQNHPNIVRLYGIAETSDTIEGHSAAYMAIQRLGPSLQNTLR